AKAQAMTETAIIAPVLLLLFFGIFQFAVLMTAYAKVAMVEREVMRFLTSEVDYKKDAAAFSREAAEKLGLVPEKLSISFEEGQEGIEGGAGLGPLKAFTGVVVITGYEQELSGFFRALTGKDFIKLKSRLVTATGGSFTVRIGRGIKEAYERVFKSEGFSEERLLNEERKWEEENIAE
ncbi:MAG TPA: pilus assembly protein, partial [bacterium]|nr:pilus assembly protein [bacterium]